jgi:hypothetical protein
MTLPRPPPSSPTRRSPPHPLPPPPFLQGTCVNVGCVPKKVMWNAAHISEVLHDMKNCTPPPSLPPPSTL